MFIYFKSLMAAGFCFLYHWNIRCFFWHHNTIIWFNWYLSAVSSKILSFLVYRIVNVEIHFTRKRLNCRYVSIWKNLWKTLRKKWLLDFFYFRILFFIYNLVLINFGWFRFQVQRVTKSFFWFFRTKTFNPVFKPRTITVRWSF